jgi:hypothetical protein
MEYEKAVTTLKSLLEKQPLTAEEKEAVQTAIGLLTLGALSKNHLKSRLQAQKAKRDKRTQW